ncbi:MAG TPA: ABC transporter substrate-binding protein [Streptosporangiaceae bacterium]|nr:ABC transporter substrate-binding protein [Streptosporangiaceae bacterium]
MKLSGTRNKLGAAAVVAAAAVISAACSSSPSSDSSSSSNTSANKPAKISVVLGNAAATYAEAPFVVAESDGQMAAHGVTTKDVLLSSSNTLLAALASGGVDFGVTDSFAVLAARAKGVPVVAVCGLYQGVPGLALVVRPSLMKSLGLKSGDVNGDLRKLKGQTIGVNSPTATGGRILTGLEQDAGLSSSWVKETAIASSTDVEALAHGEIAGYFEDVPIPQESLQDHSGVIAFTTANVPALAKLQYDVIATSESYLQSHQAAVKQFLAGLETGQTALSQKQPQALKAIAHIYNQSLPASVIDDSATTGVDTGCSMPAADWQAAASAANKWKLSPSTITGSDLAAAYKTGL